MPPKEAKSTKNWGQADRDLLEDLTNRQLIDISDTTYQYIKQVRDLHFRHRDKKIFYKNFHNYSAAWDIKIEYSGARRNGGKMRRSILIMLCQFTSTTTLHPPPPPLSISLDEEVAANEEGIDDDTDAAADAANAAPDDDDYAAADDATAADDNDDATMPSTKVKPLPTNPTKKDAAAAAAKPPPPPAAAATSFSVDANDPLTDNYYADGAYDFANVVFCVKTMQKGEYQVRVAEDGLLVSFV